MVNCVIKNWQGEQVGETTFEMRVAREGSAVHVVHRALVRQLNNQRQGTASSKTRAEVRGGGRKPWRQKGTGRARAGSIRSPLWRGGGVIFGPKPRDFSTKMNKKERRLALRTAFVSRAEDFIIIENFTEQLTSAKTKDFVNGLVRLGIPKCTKTLIIVADQIPENLERASNNLGEVKVIKHNCLNIFNILNATKIVITSEALIKIQEVYNDD